MDAGWSVVLVEANEMLGGAVRTAEVTAPGFRNDLFSAFYPLAAASPVIRDLALADHGLSWTKAPTVLTHVFPDDRSVSLELSPEATAAALDDAWPGDGAAWLMLVEHWQRVSAPLLDALFTPFPPVRSATRLLRGLGTAGALEFARLGMLPVRRLGDELFSGDGAPALLTGNAMHSDVGPDAAGSGLFGWLLCTLGQGVGFPTPVGGAQALPDALAARFRSSGGVIRTGSRVEAVEVTAGRVAGVRRRAVLADVDAPTLFGSLVGHEKLPPRFVTSLARFHWDNPTLKLNWALSAPMPLDGGRLLAVRNRSPRGGRLRVRRPRSRPVGRQVAEGPVRSVWADEHGGPDPVAGRNRERLGLHPSAAPRGGRPGFGERARRSGPGGDRGAARGSAPSCWPRMCSGRTTSRPPTAISSKVRSTPARPASTSSSSSDRRRGSDARRLRSPGCTSPERRRTRGRGSRCLRMERRSGGVGRFGAVRKRLLRSA